jgi:hypothetical protein
MRTWAGDMDDRGTLDGTAPTMTVSRILAAALAAVAGACSVPMRLDLDGRHAARNWQRGED